MLNKETLLMGKVSYFLRFVKFRPEIAGVFRQAVLFTNLNRTSVTSRSSTEASRRAEDPGRFKANKRR
jgi:hypothetical protein